MSVLFTWALLACVRPSTPSVPAEVSSPATEKEAPPVPARPPFCEGYDQLFAIEAQRAALLMGGAAAREQAETRRQAALRVLSEAFGDHPVGVAEGIDALLRAPIAIDNPDTPAPAPPIPVEDALSRVRGYVGPICRN